MSSSSIYTENNLLVFCFLSRIRTNTIDFPCVVASPVKIGCSGVPNELFASSFPKHEPIVTANITATAMSHKFLNFNVCIMFLFLNVYFHMLQSFLLFLDNTSIFKEHLSFVMCKAIYLSAYSTIFKVEIIFYMHF